MEKTNNTSIQAQAIVKSPSRNVDLRNGVGFSLGEIKAAGKTIQIIKNLGLRIDYYRKSIHKSNIEQLEKLTIPPKRGRKKEPFILKEKKVRIRTKKDKKKRKPKKVAEPPISKQKIKKTTIAKEKVEKKSIPKEKIKEETIPKTTIKLKKEAEKPIKEKLPSKSEVIPKEKLEIKGTPLTKLSGLGSTTEKKFIDVGVNNVEELIKENPEELSILLTGVSESRLKKWIEEGENLLNQ